MSVAVVAGGGIAGILSALLLSESERFKKIILIEKNDVLGGLLNSSVTEEGYSFDCGTHLLGETGILELDELLLKDVMNDWKLISPLKVSTYFNGTIQHEGPCIDARLIDEPLYYKGVVELLNSKPVEEGRIDNLADQLVMEYGQTFADELFARTIKKLFNTTADQLIPGAHELFVPRRIKILAEHISAELKGSPYLDSKIAFHQIVDQRRSYYPHSGGIGQWISILEDRLRRNGIEVILNDHIRQVVHENGKVRAVRTSTEEIALDQLVWSIPPGILYKMVKQDGTVKMPKIRKVKLFHFVFDAPFNCDCAYLNNYDQTFSSFRITFYANMNSEHNGYRCTVEVLFSDDHCDIRAETIVDELKRMQVLKDLSNLLYCKTEELPTGFPLLTKQYVNELNEQVSYINQNFNNVLMVGKSNGSGFFLNDVLINTYHSVKELG
ncbi:NAD(P)-binding protein [Cohnella sp. AR92]|uniref:NAD(P)-binding protein n=1 Tax=Cohnella sp. AR92 TaxID=648716 RepID=UPI000F8E7287|nr:NAD(P)-binding protein [Cohnella sp. AR92]RUS43051.1 hypothetical protein ELR57_25435 [Cohnella sp. AR92]